MDWEFSGKNVETAIKTALKELGFSKEDIEIKILDEGKAGLFGMMGSHPARIKVSSSKKPDLVDWDLSLKKAKEFTLLIANKIDDTAVVESERAGRKIKLMVNGENRSVLIGKKGSNLKALNYIVGLMMKKDPKTRVDILIDSGGYRTKKMEEALKEFETGAEKVRETGKSFELSPMEAEERKAIHNKAKKAKGISTSSTGSDEARRIVIKPE